MAADGNPFDASFPWGPMATRKARPPPPRDLVLREIVRRVVQVARPEKVVLFGSSAKGTAGPNSDVDLLVIARVDHRRRTAQAIYRRLLGIPVPVDVVVATPEDVRRHGERVGSILRPALREGRVVYAA